MLPFSILSVESLNPDYNKNSNPGEIIQQPRPDEDDCTENSDLKTVSSREDMVLGYMV